VTNRLAQEGRFLATAFSLLTRLRVPGLAGFEESWLASSVPYFPVAGLAVGLAAAAAYLLAGLLWPAGVAAVAALATAAWMTGGLHEDGWADVFDGLAASRDGNRERMLAAMKDSRIGSIGGLALILLLLGKLAALAALPAGEVVRSLLAAHLLSRWSNLPLLWRLPYVRPEGGMGRALAGNVTGGRFAAGSAVALVLTAAVLGGAILPIVRALAATALAALGAGLFFRRRLGGITGDCLGATQQLAELAVLLALTGRFSFPR
jgi:adenosylcobinamide-GDP ribazoletransferase